MELVRLKRRLKNNMEVIKVNDNLLLDLASKDKEVTFEVGDNKLLSIYLYNIEEKESITFNVGNDSNVLISIFAKKPINQSKITANVGKNSKITTYFADFTIERNHLEATINLNEDNAECEWHLASLSSQTDDKQIAVSMYHNHSNTHGRIDNYGVCKENSKLVFSGISHILKGSHQSTSHQNAKIVVFDNECKAIAKPILKIDENDIEASHAAVVGKVSDEHIFYLTSRGLSVDEAKLLITLGYLKPILKGFNEEVQNEINTLIEGRL